MPELTISQYRDLLLPRLDALAICLSHSWGGLEQVAAADALAVAELGLKCRFLCLQGSPLHEHLAHRSELQLLPLDFKPRNHLDFRLRGELKRLIASGTNLVHTHQTSTLGSIVPWLLGHPSIGLIASRHIMNDHNKRDFYHAAIYGRLDSLVVMSQALRQNVLETHAIRERRVRVVNLGLDFDKFDPEKVDGARYRREWGVDEKTTLIGLVGRIDPAKGQATLIQAAARLCGRENEGRNLKFVIVGEETLGSVSQYLEELKTMVAQFRLEDRVVFAGYQDDIPAVMQALDIFVMPSRQEAFGLVAIEAMAMEKPVVISAGGSADEIVGNAEYGLTVRPDDAFDLEQKLRSLLENEEGRTKVARKARAHVKRLYDRKVRIRSLLEIYDHTLRRRGNG